MLGLWPGSPAAASLSAAALPAPLHNPPPRGVRQPPPFCESSPPGCPSPPLLPVWMNVSCLSPWLLDFHTVRFCQFWLVFVFKLLLSFFWLCEEAQCVYLCLHLGWKSHFRTFSLSKKETPYLLEITFQVLLPAAPALGNY